MCMRMWVHIVRLFNCTSYLRTHTHIYIYTYDSRHQILDHRTCWRFEIAPWRGGDGLTPLSPVRSVQDFSSDTSSYHKILVALQSSFTSIHYWFYYVLLVPHSNHSPFCPRPDPRPLQSPRNRTECLPKPNHRRVGMAQCWWTCWSACWKPPRLMRGTSRRNRPCCSMKDWEIIWMIWNDLTTTSLWMTGSQGNYSQAAFCSRLMRLL